MPVITSSYQAPRFLRNGHVQTVLPTFLPRARPPQARHERLELEDGDFLELRWYQAGHKRLAILSHGLEGSTDAIYIRSMSAALLLAGWNVLAWNFRGCGGTENRLPRSYHSGESGDLRSIIGYAADDYEQVALVGFSLGGNITLKCLGEQAAHPHIVAAAAVSSPVDLASSARVLDELPGNRLYLKRFLNTLIIKIEAKARLFPDSFDIQGIRAIHTIKEFDDRFTAPMHGFRDADDYWERASSLPHLGKVEVPTLLLNALNDPLLTTPSFPEELAAQSPHLHLEMPAYGGHVGFLDHRLRGWHERRVVEFIGACAGD
ncbi:alpha/beta fold hydrolase [Prosthecobacter sp. SYSU 5D2]|uniref:YheT family hydrolase n=1 Tax=Prosthecobacter sp. SYSU 5D2 TaxID=3134134 RepID=UPI0031FEB5BB